VTTLARYRVWCLSWSDEEAGGSDVVGYDAASRDSSYEERGSIPVPSELLRGAADAAERYADFAHWRRDGWESTWPLAFRVRGPDGTIQDFEVDREYVAEFRARTARPTKQPHDTEDSSP